MSIIRMRMDQSVTIPFRPRSLRPTQVVRFVLLAVITTVVSSAAAFAQQIVGESGSPPHAVLWKNGVMTDLGTLGGSTSQAWGVNAAGQVVGSAETASGDVHAFLWQPGVGMRDLGTLPGDSSSVAVGINAHTHVVGWSDTNGAGHAFLWTEDDGMIDLGTLGGTNSSATAINNVGTVVGASDISSGYYDFHAFSWTRTTGMTDLGTLGGSRSSGRGINNGGQIVGAAINDQNYGDLKAALWANGTVTDLGDLGVWYPWSEAYGINDQGQVVGSSGTPSGGVGAFLWQGGTMTDLGNLGVAYAEAYAISASGAVVGMSGNAEGEARAFLWKSGVMTDLGGSNSRAWAIADLPELQVKQISFTNGNIEIYKDQIGSAPLIANPVWKDTNLEGQNSPVAYARNATMKATVVFSIYPTPSEPVSYVTIEGYVEGFGTFRKTGVTIPAASEVTVTDITADTPLPNMTSVFNPMTIVWRHMYDGDTCPRCIPDGSTSVKVYTTLAAPLRKVFLTSLNLAVSNEGATDQSSAFQNTWAQFAGPAGVRTWQNRELFYYREDVPFSNCALTEESLLTSANGSGQCGSWAYLLIGALGVNGIEGSFVQIKRADDPTGLFAVKDFSFGAPSFPDEPQYRWKMTFNSAAIAAGDIMVPKQPGNVYGDLTSLSTLPGQNTAPPSEKVFSAHFIVKVTLFGVTPSYYDPSYGVTYLDASDFESKAVDGYVDHFPGDPSFVFRVRRPSGSANISFDR